MGEQFGHLAADREELLHRAVPDVGLEDALLLHSIPERGEFHGGRSARWIEQQGILVGGRGFGALAAHLQQMAKL